MNINATRTSRSTVKMPFDIKGYNITSIQFNSILFCTFIVLNLCQADFKAQHQNPIKNHHSIAIAKSNIMEMPDRGYTKLGKPF